MAQFFIRRPIVAMVISILIVLVGTAALLQLPVEQYPQLAPPNIQVTATYPGAGAEVVEQSVATPVEQQINGVDHMLYMKSLNSSDGRLQLNVTFRVGTDRDVANTLTQNRVSQAQSRLPQEVVQQGLTVKKVNPSILMVVSIYSPQSTYDELFLNNYAVLYVKDALLRVPGVSQVDLGGGAEYGMRIWLDPDKLAKLGLTPADVVGAIRQQNIQAPAGQVGAAPSAPDQEFTYTVRAPAKFNTPEAFGDLLVRSTADGRQVRVRDVARVELGAESYKAFGRYNGKPAGVLLVYLLPGANQIETAQGVYSTLADLRQFFPDDVDYGISYDTTPAVQASIEGIVHTLLEAVVLVVLVVFLFLQNLRATLIPLLTVPVSLLGAFALFPFLGFTVNTLSLFGMVLAIGIVVDDAIVVVEAVMHHLEHGLSPRDATVQAMKEVSGPVVGIALILSAVFIPVAFLGGLVGQLYQQFALTIALAVLISAFNALSLSPALACLLLRPPATTRPGPLGKFFGMFNRGFEAATNSYVRLAGSLARKAVLSLLLVGLVTAGAGGFARILPTGFVPDEDQGIFLVNVQLPNAASLERTREVCGKIDALLARTPGVDQFNAVGGMSFLSGTFTPNAASYFVRLKDWKERRTPALSLSGILRQVGGQLMAIPEAIAFPFAPPALPGFGAAGGFAVLLQDRSGTLSVSQLGEAVAAFMAAARQRPELTGLFTAFDPRVPQVALEVDREKVSKLGVPIHDVFTTLQASLGGAYVNDFNRFGRLYRVFVQAESRYRQTPDDLGHFHVRSTAGQMIPLATLTTVKPDAGTELTVRYNLLRSVELSGRAAPGYSSGQAMAALEEVAARSLPREMSLAYTGLSYEERTAPNPMPTFVLAILFVFLLLAALYESWSLPWSVLLGTPLVALGAFCGVWARGMDNNVYVQIGLVMLIGLAAKNAILIVEFAKMKKEEGLGLIEAALEAARLRFRPILMTAFAFILGVVPLVIATGSGANSRQVMGTAVFSGMLVATAAGVFIIPALYVLVERLGGPARPRPASPPTPADPAAAQTQSGGAS